jgi:ubiquinone/menaquinone biosynthesis C-methylase UbiE
VSRPAAGLDPYLRFLREKREEVRAYYDREAERYAARWVPANRHYYRLLEQTVAELVPPGRRVLDVGCGLGDLLAATRPAVGVGVDFSAGMLAQARRRHPHLDFHELDGEEVAQLGETFDYVLLCNTLGEVADVRRLLVSLRGVMTAETRLVVTTSSHLWEPALQLGARLGLRPPSPCRSWFSPQDYRTLFASSGLEVVQEGRRVLSPKWIPGVSDLLNGVGVSVPGLRELACTQFFVLRALPLPEEDSLRVTVVVPCKDEVDNVPELVARIPDMGAGTEIVFVDDRSTDGTGDAVRAQMEAHPERDIKLVEGPGKGKGAAVRAGCAVASGDVYMILDADMTVMPEVLPDFLQLIASGQGEFVNGSRLVYAMEDGAMRLANELGNKAFALLFTFILDQPIKDTLCGTKVVRARDYPKLLETRAAFGEVDLWGDYDWIFGAARHHLRIVELPVHYRARTAGETKMTGRLRNAAVMLRMSLHGLRHLKLGRSRATPQP